MTVAHVAVECSKGTSSNVLIANAFPTRNDEQKPAEESLSKWKSRICALPVSALSTDGIMAGLDKQTLDSDIMNYIRFLVTRVRALENTVR